MTSDFTESENRLTNLFSQVGREYNFTSVKVEISEYTEMKIKWERSYETITFHLSDYLENMPDDVAKGMAETIFGRIRGQSTVYSEEVTDWLENPEFSKARQDTFIRRKGLKDTCKGHVDVQASYDRLVKSGRVERDELLRICWLPRDARAYGESSVLMRTVALSPRVDVKEMPDDLLDFLLYTQLLHIDLGFDPGNSNRREEYEQVLEDAYPGNEYQKERLFKEFDLTLR